MPVVPKTVWLFGGYLLDTISLSIGRINLYNAEATFVQSKRMQRFFEKQLNPVMLVLIG